MLSQNIVQSLIGAVEAIDSLDDLTVPYSSWLFHDSGSPNTCTDCNSQDGHVFKVEDPSDLLLIFPFGVFVAEDTFAVNIHKNCECFLTLEPSV